jgi:hypothetical protein
MRAVLDDLAYRLAKWLMVAFLPALMMLHHATNPPEPRELCGASIVYACEEQTVSPRPEAER